MTCTPNYEAKYEEGVAGNESIWFCMREKHDIYNWNANCNLNKSTNFQRQKEQKIIATSNMIATSLVTSRVQQLKLLLDNIIQYTEFRIFVHVSCKYQKNNYHYPTSTRIVFNEKCTDVHRGYGSILHAHLLNIEKMSQYKNLPSHVFFHSDDMIWFKHGITHHILKHNSSLYAAQQRKIVRPSYDNDWKRISEMSTTKLFMKHEGSFYPWSVVFSFLHFLNRIPLNRLNIYTCMCIHSACIEEIFIPSFSTNMMNYEKLNFQPPTQLFPSSKYVNKN
tara:strand:+ start:455 stop:1288 length:834 start_codon:yes stop_codon:yes gene_type:complete